MKNKSGIDFKNYFHVINNQKNDFDPVINYVGDAGMVLMGEATHGTQEFYKARADIAKRLITEKGFKTIAIEGDFPDTYRINRYINFQGDDSSAIESLGDFKRFPAWMWRNEEVVSFIQWLYNYNKSQQKKDRVSIYGMDLYSLHRSISVVINTLSKIDPKAAEQAKEWYACFEQYKDPQEYGCIASIYKDKSCQDNVIKALQELKEKDVDSFTYDDLDPLEEKFYVEQNALVVKDAEYYYRSLFGGTEPSWNIRDSHMMQMIKDIQAYNRAAGKDDKMIVWAHNSHVGDARFTQMGRYGELNVGQLVKESYGADAVAIGFTTYSGTVSAASAWGGEVERKTVRPALDESIESFFHSASIPAFIAVLPEHPALYDLFAKDDYLQRAIGVIYLPHTERQSHYFYALVAKQFDIVIHYDLTHAVTPLEKSTQWHVGEEDAPETFPFGV